MLELVSLAMFYPTIVYPRLCRQCAKLELTLNSRRPTTEDIRSIYNRKASRCTIREMNEI